MTEVHHHHVIEVPFYAGYSLLSDIQEIALKNNQFGSRRSGLDEILYRLSLFNNPVQIVRAENRNKEIK